MMTKKKTARLARAKLMIALPLALSMMLFISINSDMLAQEEKDPPPPPPKKEKEVNKPVKSDKEPVIVTVVEKPAKDKKEPKVVQMVEYQDEEPVFTVVEDMPKYPGGNKAMYSFMGQNIKYPQDAKEKGIQGKVYVSFVVEKDGSVSHVKILRGVSKSLDSEAMRVVKSMPNWEPGTQKGKAVRVQYNLPIKFTLDSGDDKKKQEDKKKIEAEKK